MFGFVSASLTVHQLAMCSIYYVAKVSAITAGSPMARTPINLSPRTNKIRSLIWPSLFVDL